MRKARNERETEIEHPTVGGKAGDGETQLSESLPPASACYSFGNKEAYLSIIPLCVGELFYISRRTQVLPHRHAFACAVPLAWKAVPEHRAYELPCLEILLIGKSTCLSFCTQGTLDFVELTGL
jgi:hypothetical protein